MLHKRFYVKIALKLHAITCPGVWLCTHGYLEATIKTLGYFFRTGAMEPHFPLLCHDQFTMEGYFKSVGSMDELERLLAAERVEITLWQNGRRLAHFLGKLSDITHVGVPKLTCAHNINVQLLMKATPAFPGIIAPKLELSAQLGIQDRSSRGSSRRSPPLNGNYKIAQLDFDGSRQNNRHCQLSEKGGSCFSYLEEPRRQKPVCHARGNCGNGSLCSNCAKTYTADNSISHKSEKRRLSSSSSHFSSNLYTLSQTSRSSSACGCFSLASDGKSNVGEEHHQSCDICQQYRKLFL